MQTVTKNILGFDINLNIVSTIAEAVEACGSEARVIELLNNYVLFHQAFGKIRSTIVETLEKETKIKRITDGAGEDAEVVEKDTAYVARLDNEGVVVQDYKAAIQALIDASPISYKASERGTGTGTKLSLKYVAMAVALREAGKFERFASKYDLDLADLDTDAQNILVGNKIKELTLAAQRAAAASALAV